MAEGKTEKELITSLDRSKIASLVNDVKKGKIVLIQARTSRREWASIRHGQWWMSSIRSEFQEEPRPHEEVSIFGTFPLTDFEKDASKGTRTLIELLKRIAENTPLVYSYSNMGNWSLRSPPFYSDILYPETRHSIPLTNFAEKSSRGGRSMYGEEVAGIFWLNVLNPNHVKALGGVSRIEEVAQPHSIQSLPNDGTMIFVTPSPIMEDNQENRDAFLRLRRVLEPLSLMDRVYWKSG